MQYDNFKNQILCYLPCQKHFHISQVCSQKSNAIQREFKRILSIRIVFILTSKWKKKEHITNLCHPPEKWKDFTCAISSLTISCSISMHYSFPVFFLCFQESMELSQEEHQHTSNIVAALQKYIIQGLGV